MRKRKGSRVERWEERLAEVIKDKMKKEREGGERGRDIERNQPLFKVASKMMKTV